MKILVLNGPNLNLLGLREPDIYGTVTLAELNRRLQEYCAIRGMETEFYQSNHEGDLIDRIQAAYGVFDGIIFNPAGYTHTSVAIADAVKAVKIPTVEVHISDPDAREEYRKISYLRPACVGTVKGKGIRGYFEAADLLSARCGGGHGSSH